MHAAWRKAVHPPSVSTQVQTVRWPYGTAPPIQPQQGCVHETVQPSHCQRLHVQKAQQAFATQMCTRGQKWMPESCVLKQLAAASPRTITTLHRAGPNKHVPTNQVANSKSPNLPEPHCPAHALALAGDGIHSKPTKVMPSHLLLMAASPLHLDGSARLANHLQPILDHLQAQQV
jgi:hypothetical protein